MYASSDHMLTFPAMRPSPYTLKLASPSAQPAHQLPVHSHTASGVTLITLWPVLPQPPSQWPCDSARSQPSASHNALQSSLEHHPCSMLAIPGACTAVMHACSDTFTATYVFALFIWTRQLWAVRRCLASESAPGPPAPPHVPQADPPNAYGRRTALTRFQGRTAPHPLSTAPAVPSVLVTGSGMVQRCACRPHSTRGAHTQQHAPPATSRLRR